MPDTLVIDTAQIAQWQTQPDYDYGRELVGGGMTFTEWLKMKLSELLGDIFGNATAGSIVRWLLVTLAIVTLVLIAWYLWRYHPSLFGRQETLATDREEAADNIYGVDFPAAIDRALAAEDYREAIRLVYLQTLKALADARLVDWQPYKTPSQYVRELAASQSAAAPSGLLCSGGAAAPASPVSAPREAAFRALTAHFLRVRYGNFPAARPLYDEVLSLGKEVSREP